MALRFCPLCSNMLLVDAGGGPGSLRMTCRTCAYVHRLAKPIRSRTECVRKVVDDVLGGASEWENVQKTAVECPECGNGEAYFRMIQTRSADEPMTTFYRCTQRRCTHTWKVD